MYICVYIYIYIYLNKRPLEKAARQKNNTHPYVRSGSADGYCARAYGVWSSMINGGMTVSHNMGLIWVYMIMIGLNPMFEATNTVEEAPKIEKDN